MAICKDDIVAPSYSLVSERERKLSLHTGRGVRDEDHRLARPRRHVRPGCKECPTRGVSEPRPRNRRRGSIPRIVALRSWIEFEPFCCDGRVCFSHTVGIVPPSITYSVPLIEEAFGDTRNKIKLATSCGFAGRPSGMPPMLCMMICFPPS